MGTFVVEPTGVLDKVSLIRLTLVSRATTWTIAVENTISAMKIIPTTNATATMSLKLV